MKKSFELLAKISSTDISQNNKLVKICAGVMKSLEALYAIIEGSPFHERRKIIKNIDEAVNDMLILCRQPELINRSKIGFICEDSKVVKNIIDGLTLKRTEILTDLYKIPLLLFHSEKIRCSVSNKFGNDIELTFDEYNELSTLSKSGINLSDIISSISFFMPLRYKASVYIFMPDEKLMNLCDTTINDNQLYEIENILRNYDGKTDCLMFTDRLKAEMLTYEAGLSKLISAYKKSSAALSREAVMQNISGTSDLIENKISEIAQLIRDIESWKNWQVKFQLSQKQNLFEMSESLEKEMLKTVPNEIQQKGFVRINSGSTPAKSLWLKIALNFITLGNINSALIYQRKAEEFYKDEAFLISLYCREALRQIINRSDFEKLRYMADSEDVLKAKIHFRRELNLSENDCANIAGILKELETSDELYFYAMHLNNLYKNKNKNISFSEVINAFRRAVLSGSTEAAEMFSQYCAGNNLFDETKEIADMAFPVASWACFLLCYQRQNNKLAQRYLKISAALGNSDALKFLADTCWNERRKSPNGLSFDPRIGKFIGIDNKANTRAISIYEHLYSMGAYSPVSDTNERLGHFYFCSGKFSKARDLIGTSPRTSDGLFDMAVMLKYAHGGGVDKNLATKFIVKAAELGHPFANALNERWFLEDTQKLKDRYNR